LFDTSPIANDRNPASVHHSQKGFSIIEMVVVCAILMIVGAMVFVNAARLLQGIRLNGSATSYANLLQQARIRAVRDDRFYSVLTTTTSNDPAAYVDIGQSGSYATGDPMMIFSQNVSPQPYSSGPGKSNLKAQFLPSNAPSNTVNTTAGGPTFGPRGLPCSPSGNTCPSLATPTAYITFLQNSATSKWAAVTVTPAGRIQSWSYDGTTWNPQN
jgi:Tfp pilus assembly protein FimT